MAKSKEAALKFEARLEAASQERDQAIKLASELTGRLEAIEQHNKELLAKLQQSENSQWVDLIIGLIQGLALFFCL